MTKDKDKMNPDRRRIAEEGVDRKTSATPLTDGDSGMRRFRAIMREILKAPRDSTADSSRPP